MIRLDYNDWVINNEKIVSMKSARDLGVYIYIRFAMKTACKWF